MTLFKSTRAVALGIFANFLAVPIDAILHGTGVFPPSGVDMADHLFIVALGYRFAAAVLGGYVTARTAPNYPLRHCLALGGIGVVMSTFGMIAMWDVGHHWFSFSLVAMSVPASWYGGRLFTKGKSA